jgi:hypothetical protein
VHLHLLKRLVAFGCVLEMKSNNDFMGHLSPALGTSYIRFSFGFSDATMPSCQFFCFVSCDKATCLDIDSAPLRNYFLASLSLFTMLTKLFKINLIIS